jgi:hypothetical protein
MDSIPAFDLEETVTAVYCALDDALTQVGCHCRDGKLIWRPGPALIFDDREALCVAVLQELLGYESDNAYFDWLAVNATMRALFPHLPSRQKCADRRALLTPLLQRLTQAFCALGGEGQPPFSSLTPIPSTSVRWCGRRARNASAAWRAQGTAQPSAAISTACVNT